MATAALNLLAKIEVVIPDKLRPHVFEPVTSIAPVSSSPEAVNSSLLRSSIRDRRKIALKYDDGAGKITQRIIWPILLGYRDAGRILAAWCELREGFRFFRTDRMVSADILKQGIPEGALALKARWRTAMDNERETYEGSGAKWPMISFRKLANARLCQTG